MEGIVGDGRGRGFLLPRANDRRVGGGVLFQRKVGGRGKNLGVGRFNK